jgi:hypothetical protein
MYVCIYIYIIHTHKHTHTHTQHVTHTRDMYTYHTHTHSSLAVGSVITFGYFEITKDGIPRFPSYKRPSREGVVERCLCYEALSYLCIRA